RGAARAALAAMRPRQWTKNLLVFAGIVFAAKLGDATRWLEAIGAFAAYCAASSAAYLVNDVRDAPHDRLHPVKRVRPVASGELGVVGAQAAPGRPVLEGYSLALVDQLVSVVAASTVIAYSLYTFTARDSKAMMATIPFVLFGVFRYLLLIQRDDLGEEPETV